MPSARASFEAAETLFVPAHVAGHSLKAAAELVDLDGDAGEGRGVTPFRSVLIDERAEIRAAIERRAVDDGLRNDRVEGDPPSGSRERSARSSGSHDVVVSRYQQKP